MNTLTYFGLRYNNPALLYLALFAATPHPYNTSALYRDRGTGRRLNSRDFPPGNDILQQDVLRDAGLTEGIEMEKLMGADRLWERDGRVGNQELYRSFQDKIDPVTGTVKPGKQVTREEIRAWKQYQALEGLKKRTESEYRPEQIQAIQRKNLLRPQALNLADESSVFEGMNKGLALDASYNIQKTPAVRDAINAAGVLDRYHRSLMGTISPGEQAIPAPTAYEAEQAKQALSKLTPTDWDVLAGSYRAVNEIRREAQPVSQVISDTTSPIGKPAKEDARKSLIRQRQNLQAQASAEGIDPRTAGQNPPTLVPDASELQPNIQAYAENPESLRYVVDNSPEAQAAKRQALKVQYKAKVPEANKPTGLERRLERIANARRLVLGEEPVTTTPVSDSRAVGDLFRDPDFAIGAEQSGIARDGGRSINIQDLIRRRREERSAAVTPPSLQAAAETGQLPPSIRNIDPPFQEAWLRGFYTKPGSLPTDQQRKLLAGIPTLDENTAGPDGPIPDPWSTPTEPIQKAVQRKPKAAKTRSQPALNAQTVDLNSDGSIAQKDSLLKRAGRWADKYILDPVYGSKAPDVTATPASVDAATQKGKEVIEQAVKGKPKGRSKVIVNLPDMNGVQDAIGNAVKNVKLPGSASSAADLYDAYMRSQAFNNMQQPLQQAEQATEKVRPQSMKLRNLLAGFPNLNERQKGGLMKLGGGVVGAGGVLLGGSMVADSLIKQKQQQEIDRQQRLYGNQPAYEQPAPYPADPYGQQARYY